MSYIEYKKNKEDTINIGRLWKFFFYKTKVNDVCDMLGVLYKYKV